MCQPSGMAVTVSVDKGGELHPGMGTRISGKVTMSGPSLLHLWATLLFFPRRAACCAGSRVGTGPCLQMQHAFTAVWGGIHQRPSLAPLPSQRAPGNKALTSCKKGHNTGVDGGGGGGVCSVQGQGDIGEIAPQLAREGEGLATAANPGDTGRSGAQADGLTCCL